MKRVNPNDRIVTVGAIKVNLDAPSIALQIKRKLKEGLSEADILDELFDGLGWWPIQVSDLVPHEDDEDKLYRVWVSYPIMVMDKYSKVNLSHREQKEYAYDESVHADRIDFLHQTYADAVMNSYGNILEYEEEQVSW
jgi:hypothetical protein